MQRPPMPSPTPEEVLRLKRKHNPIKPTELVAKGLLLLIGAFIFAIGLEAFLVPNQIIDGGIVGVSIITSYLTETKLAIWLVLFNLPFIFFGYRQIGKTFAVVTLIAIMLMSGFTILFHSIEPFTDDLLYPPYSVDSYSEPGLGSSSGQADRSTGPRFWPFRSQTGSRSLSARLSCSSTSSSSGQPDLSSAGTGPCIRSSRISSPSRQSISS